MTRRTGRHGRRWNRRGPRAGAHQPPAHLNPEKIAYALGVLQYHVVPLDKAVTNFQRDYNAMVRCGSMEGGRISVGKPTHGTVMAIGKAIQFQNKMPKSWIYYVKKCRTIMPDLGFA